MAQTHRCPHCQSINTVATLQESTCQLYLCRTCRTVWGTFDMSLRGAATTAGAAKNERSDK
jgi:transposase-like protein